MPIALEDFQAHLKELSHTPAHISYDKQGFNRARARQQIFSDQGWHDHVLRIVASCVARGFDDFEIHILCDTFVRRGYTEEQTQQEVQRMINGARTKGFAPASVTLNRKALPTSKSLLTLIGDVEPSPVKYLIEGIIECQSLIGLVGASGCGKSFVAIDMAMSIATGLAYHGRSVERGLVIMCVGEGHSGMPSRCGSWCAHHGTDKAEANLAITERAAELFNETYLEKFYQETAELVDKFGPLRLIVFDTVARHMPGMDENSAKDMGALIQTADKLKQEFNCSIMFVHHTGLSSQDRARGSSAFKAALDTEILLNTVGSHDIAMKCDKQKDGPPFEQIQFIKLSTDNSLVLEEVTASTRSKKSKLSDNDKLALSTLNTALENVASSSVHLDQWRAEFKRRHTGDNSKSKDTAMQRARKKLQHIGLIIANDDYYSLGDKATQ